MRGHAVTCTDSIIYYSHHIPKNHHVLASLLRSLLIQAYDSQSLGRQEAGMSAYTTRKNEKTSSPTSEGRDKTAPIFVHISHALASWEKEKRREKKRRAEKLRLRYTGCRYKRKKFTTTNTRHVLLSRKKAAPTHIYYLSWIPHPPRALSPREPDMYHNFGVALPLLTVPAHKRDYWTSHLHAPHCTHPFPQAPSLSSHPTLPRRCVRHSKGRQDFKIRAQLSSSRFHLPHPQQASSYT